MNVLRARRTLLWGVLTLTLGGALLATFPMASGALRGAQREAEQGAEGYADSVLYKSLTPGMVAHPITGRDYSQVLVDVQAGILTNDDVVRVRIWSLDATLVFSSDQRDRIGQQAGFNGLLRRVAQNGTMSDVTGDKVAPQPGLAGSTEQLLRIYVPLRLGSGDTPSAVAEIDERYAAVRGAAQAVWRPIQGLLAALLLGALVMLVLAIRDAGSRGTLAGTDPRSSERAKALEKQLKDVERRAKEAEERAEAVQKAKAALEQQLAANERTLREALSAAKAGDDAAALAARVPELERELAELRARGGAPAAPPEELHAALARAREAEAERDRMMTEVQRLNIAISEGGAAHSRVAELEAKIADLDRRAEDAERRAADADALRADAERRAADAERRAADAQERSRTVVGQSQADLDRISLRLSETQDALVQATDRVTSLEAEVERLERERENAVAELQRAGMADGERDQELRRLQAALTEREQELARLQAQTAERDQEWRRIQAEAVAKNAELDALRGEAVAKNAELDALRADAAARASELERHRAALTEKDGELSRLRAELERVSASAAASTDAAASAPDAAELQQLRARVAELEELHRTDVSDVQQAHEQLANVQLELTQAKKRIEELEQRAWAAATADAESPLPASNGDAVPLGEPSFAAADPTAFPPPEEATIGSRLSAFRRRRHSQRLEEATAEAAPPEAVGEPPAVEEQPAPEPEPVITAEGLSLRERLTRAAAARHRVSAPSDSEQR